MILVPMTVAVSDVSVPMGVASGDLTLSAEISLKYAMDSLDRYDGALEFTPSSEAQVIPTANKSVLENITIKPIPNNYGLITWNGSTLTVS